MIAGCCFLIGLLGASQLPKLRALILVQIEKFSRERLPVRVLPENIDITFLPPGAAFRNVNVLPKEETEPFLDSAHFDSIRIALSPIQLIGGRVRLTSLEIEGARIEARLPVLPKKKTSGPPLAGFFQLLSKIPINLIQLKDVSARLAMAEPKMKIEIDDIDWLIEKKRGNTLNVDLHSASLQIFHFPVGGSNKGNSSQPSLKIDIEASTSISRNEVTLEKFMIRRGDSSLEASGLLKGDFEQLAFSDFEVKLNSSVNLESLGAWGAKTFPDKFAKVPKFSGRSSLDGEIHRKKNAEPEASFQLSTAQFAIDNILLDKIAGKFSYQVLEQKPTIKSDKITIDHPAGVVSVDNLEAVIASDSTSLTASLQTKQLQLHELLKSVGAGVLPVYMQLGAQFPCTGTIVPEFRLNCRGQLEAENLLVRDAMTSKSTIVALRRLNADGEVAIDLDKVTYSADLSMANSKGRSSGSVGFATGFKINYDAEKLDFADITNLSDLKIDGIARVKGSTEGDSSSAVFALELDASDLWLEDFWLGKTKGLVAYKKGELSFSNLQGYYAVSRYTADLKLNVLTNEINLLARAPFFEAKDILKVVSRQFELPVPVTGTGSAQIRASGPLSIARMSYDLSASLFKGTIAGETFDQVNFDVKSIGGEVKAEKVQLTKGGALVKVTGRARPDGRLEALVTGSGLKLEESVLLSKSGLAITGNFDFDMDLIGSMKAPETEMRGHLTKTAIGEQLMADSNFNLKFHSKSMDGEGTFLGEAIQASFTIPFSNDIPFGLKVLTRDWNYTSLFAALAGPASRKDFAGKLTADIDINAPKGGLWNSNGSIRIDSFQLDRGNQTLRTRKPIVLRMSEGRFTTESFELMGNDNSFITVTDNPKPVTKLDVQANGKFDIGLLSLLTPSLEELRGNLSFAVNVRNGPELAEVLGSAYLEKGHVKLFDFPHPIENLAADLLFNHRKVMFNSIKANLGDGRVSAQGQMEFKGPKELPIDIAGTFEKVTLNIPDKVKSVSSGAISFSGTGLPYTLKINAKVGEGLWAKEFGENSSELLEVRRSQYLPELLAQERTQPVLLDIGIDLNNGIQIKNELVDGKVTGNLEIKGDPSKPSILGQINLEKGSRIIVKDTVFDVTTGDIQLDDPKEINPKLYIAANARVQEYNVNLLVQGSTTKTDLNFTSVPPLPKNEIISLLALGSTSTSQGTPSLQSGSGLSSGPKAEVSTGIGKNNPISKEIKAKTGFEVQFAPSFDEQSVTQRIIVKKQFNDKLGVAASQSIGTRRSTDAEARYRLNDRFSGILSWQNRDNLGTLERSTNQREQNQFGLDLEYKFEFK